jgi:hypothetical protein
MNGRSLLPWLFAASLAGGAAPAWAQEILRLRANEHSAFSRLAIEAPDLAEWRATQRDRSVEIVLTDRDATLDAKAIFPDRRVSRVLSAKSERRGADMVITLSLACRCVAEVYELDGGMLMLDIRDAEQDVRRSTSSPRRPAADQAPASAVAQTMPAPAPAIEAQAATPLAQTSSQAVASADSEHAPDPVGTPAPTGDNRMIKPDGGVAAVVAEAQRRLLEQLSRAAEQGLVDFRKPQERPRVAPSAPPTDPAAPYPAEPHGADDVASAAPPAAARAHPSPEDHGDAPKAPSPTAAQSQISITSVFQKDARARVKPPREECISDARLALPVIATAEKPVEAIAKLRRELVSEFDEVNVAAGLELIRTYLALGFGAEAIAVAASLNIANHDLPLLTDLARVVDGLPYAPDGPLAAARDCGGQALIWRLAAPGADGHEVNEGLEAAASLAQSLGSVPPPLRHLLGPGVLTALVAAGRMDAARQSVSVLERAPGPQTEERHLAMAKYHAADGRDAEADRMLRDLLRRSGPAAAEANALLVERLLARHAKVGDPLIEATAAAALAYRGAPLGARLKAAEIRARGGGRFVEALDVLETEIARDGPDDPVLQMVARELFLAADPEEIGAAAYAGAAIARAGRMGVGPESDVVRAATATRLTGIGLGNAALAVLAPSLRRSDVATLAGAQAHVALGDGAAALALLQGADTPEAQSARVAALVADGRYGDAWQAVEADAGATVDGPTRAAFAWRAGDWRAAAALAPDSPRAPFAAWASRIGPEDAARAVPGLSTDAIAAMGVAPDTGEPSLSGARALLARTRTAESLFQKAMTDG